MTTVKAKLSAKYLYVRCDEDFQLNFTNGSSMPFWKGFYCLLTEDLQKYNTNNDLDIVASDSATIWWLSSDTLIMSVTDINTDLLQILTDSNVANLQANNLQNNYLFSVNSLLMSIQNSLSTFLNAYVEANSIVDYGFQQGSIDSNGVCNLYIAKPSSVNKYEFNCKISYYGTISRSAWGNGSFQPAVISNLSGMVLSWNSSTNKFELTHPSKSIEFDLYDNTNQLLTGYTISNAVMTSEFSFSGSGVKYLNGSKINYGGCSFSGSLFSDVNYVSPNFVLGSLSTESKNFTSVGQATETPISGYESFDIVFDVAKT